jgi:hypothetical protein
MVSAVAGIALLRVVGSGSGRPRRFNSARITPSSSAVYVTSRVEASESCSSVLAIQICSAMLLLLSSSLIACVAHTTSPPRGPRGIPRPPGCRRELCSTLASKQSTLSAAARGPNCAVDAVRPLSSSRQVTASSRPQASVDDHVRNGHPFRSVASREGVSTILRWSFRRIISLPSGTEDTCEHPAGVFQKKTAVLQGRSRADESAAGPIAIPATDPAIYGRACTYAALVRATLTVGVFRNVDEASSG